jgi:Contractile injection system tube protein/LysM domain
MPIPVGFQRARLEIDGGKSKIECAFNPESYTVSKTNVWNFKPTTGEDLPPGEFGGGLPQVMQFSLLLDASLAGPDQSVKDQADSLFKMMEKDGGAGSGDAPPKVQFLWGSFSLPEAVPVSLTVQYVLFHPNGEPIRAMVDLELAQSKKAEKGQNPTTRAITGMRVHRVRDGDSLHSIAYASYGDPTRWRAIAEANGVDNPLRLRRGSELTIPRVE